MLEFLQSMALDPTSMTDTTSLLGPILALSVAFLIIALIILVAIYIYLSLAFLKIGRKVGLSEGVAGLAWIPFLGPMIITYLASGMHWWSWIVLSIGLMIPVVNILVLIFAVVITTYWMWKTFIAVGRPGWWSLIAPIGYVLGFLIGLASGTVGAIICLLAGVAHLVLIGIAAWGSAPTATKPAMKPVRPMKK